MTATMKQLRLLCFCLLLNHTAVLSFTTKTQQVSWKVNRQVATTIPRYYSNGNSNINNINSVETPKPLIVLQSSAVAGPVIPSRAAPTASAPASASDAPVTRSDRKKRLATGMAFLTGCADILLFLKYKTFATMMTGNLMWLATAFVDGNVLNIGYYSSVIASYMVGLAAFRRMDFSLRKKCLRICSLVVAALFIGSDAMYMLTKSRWLPVMLLSAGFGVINSVGSEVAGTLTFVVTGHMTKITHMVVDRFSKAKGRKKFTDADKESFKQNMAVIGGFFGGAVFACALKLSRFSAGIFSSLGLLYGLLFFWLDMESLGGAWWLRKGKKMCEVDDDGEICDIPVLAAGSLLNATSILNSTEPALSTMSAMNTTSVNVAA